MKSGVQTGAPVHVIWIWEGGKPGEGLARKLEVAWMDESFLYSHFYRCESWCKKGDSVRDSKKRGDGQRLCLIDGLTADGVEDEELCGGGCGLPTRGSRK